MLSPLELASLDAVHAALEVRFAALRDFHRRHPSPSRWDDADRAHLLQMRRAIAVLRERERILERR